MKPLHVAVGVVLDEARNILITRRSANSHQGGLWEFPGGKVEAGESIEQALTRELHEELGVVLQRSEPLLQVHHDYSDKAVLLDVYIVSGFSGVARGMEGQPFRWVAEDTLDEYSFPAANAPIVLALRRWLKSSAGRI